MALFALASEHAAGAIMTDADQRKELSATSNWRDLWLNFNYFVESYFWQFVSCLQEPGAGHLENSELTEVNPRDPVTLTTVNVVFLSCLCGSQPRNCGVNFGQ